MTRKFQFDGYTVRPVQESDRAYLDKLIEADPYHRHRFTAGYFLNLQPGEDAWAMEDRNGEVVLYFRTSTAVRIAIQFADSIDRTRNRHALIKGMYWLEETLRGNHFREILFDTEGPRLSIFARRHLGFRLASLLTRYIGQPGENPSSALAPPALGGKASEPQPTPPPAVGTVPTTGQ